MTTLLKNDAFLWSDSAAQSFNELKVVVTNPHVLSLPDFSEVFVVECDACATGVGAVKSLSQTLRCNYLSLSTYKKELLALVLTVRKWRSYLLGGVFVFRTNHHSLKYLLE